MDLDYRLNRVGLRTVTDTLSDFLPEMAFSRIDKDKRELIFKTPDGEVPLQHLSDGYQNVAAWVGDLLYRLSQVFEDYKNPLGARGLLLIDEVDLHLHPK
jgi:predicted ATP-binding protein involved in virulence